MPNHTPIKNSRQEIQQITHQSIIAFMIMGALLVLLFLRLTYLQVVQHTLYTTLSNKNALDLIPLEPTRGLIYDRNGVLLAENMPVFSLDVIPNKIKNLSQTLIDLRKIIAISDQETIQLYKNIRQHRRFDEIPLKLSLTENEVARFAENSYRLPGLQVKARLIRHYPFGVDMSHALGYVGRINVDELAQINPTNYSATHYIGKLGAEKYYEADLHGQVGYQQAEVDARGEPLRILKQINPIPGKNLRLSLDSKLQIRAATAMAGHRGAIVAIQPSTGQILAFVSTPSYDPNAFVTGISHLEFNALQQSPTRPLYNRALRGLYPLASTIKPYLALQGLNTATVTAATSIEDPGWYQLPNSTHYFHDWKRMGHGHVNLHKAIVSSCDVYFYDLAHKMGIQAIDDILNDFGFGQLSGIDLGGEAKGVIASPAWKRKMKGQAWYEGDTILSSIGQGYMQATPLQLAVAVATLANRGLRIAPSIVLNQPSSLPVKQLQPRHPEYWDTIIDAMQDVIRTTEGTAHHFGKNPSYTIAAKTGTAQVYAKKHFSYDEANLNQNLLPEQLRNHSLFIAFAPVKNPQIAIAIVIEHNADASKIARQVLDAYLAQPQSLNMQFREEKKKDATH